MTFALLEGPDLIIVLLIALLIFGGSRLPGLARSLGEAQREFRRGHEGVTDPAPLQGSEAEAVTMSKAELDALLKEHEERIRADAAPSEPPSPLRRVEPLRAQRDDGAPSSDAT